MAYDADLGKVVLFGGDGTTGGLLNDTWTWDGEDWSKLPGTVAPMARSAAVMSYDAARGKIVLFGGVACSSDETCSTPNDTWTWDGSTWRDRTGPLRPAGRVQASMAYDAGREEVVLFGGANRDDGQLNDTWIWRGTRWVERTPIESPPRRQSAAMAYDAAAGHVVLFGGCCDQRDDTWIWDGSSWTEQPRTWPELRWRAAAAFDKTADELVVFGGNGASDGLRNDTWTWDGRDWTLETPTQAPAPREAAMSAFDEARNEIVMFGGGDTARGIVLDDTWVWDGSEWAQRDPATAPSARRSAAMAYDPRRREVVLFGGTGVDGDLGDTWVWDGGTWTERSTPIEPDARSNAQMAYDRTHHVILLFGGLPGSSPGSDRRQQRHLPGQIQELASFGRTVGQGSRRGDRLTGRPDRCRRQLYPGRRRHWLRHRREHLRDR